MTAALDETNWALVHYKFRLNLRKTIERRNLSPFPPLDPLSRGKMPPLDAIYI
jgi:hypothetical protein